MQRCSGTVVHKHRGAQVHRCTGAEEVKRRTRGEEVQRCNDAVAGAGTEVQIKVLR